MKRELKENPLKSDKTIKVEVFDNLKEVSNGYYLVLGIFTDATLRDKFIMKLIDSGDFNASFFFNINSLSYYVYSDNTKIWKKFYINARKRKKMSYIKKLLLLKLKLILGNILGRN